MSPVLTVHSSPSAPAKREAPLILGIGGTLRPTSSSERALMASLEAVREAGGRTMSLVGRDLELPTYEPGARLDERARRLVEAFRQCDGLIIACPSYHGAIPGLLKNAIDYTEEMAHDERPYLMGRAVGLIVCAAGWQGVGTTLIGLRSIVHALRGWPTPLGAGLNTADRDPRYRSSFTEKEAWQLAEVARDVVDFAARRAPAAMPEPVRAAAGGA